MDQKESLMVGDVRVYQLRLTILVYRSDEIHMTINTLSKSLNHLYFLLSVCSSCFSP